MPDATIGYAGMRIVRLLVGTPPQTMADLMDATGVTRTAIMEQLNDLINTGFVERTKECSSSRGRPRHRFRATEAAALLLVASSQQVVVPAIWRAIHEIGGEELSQKVLKLVSRQMVDHYCERITAKRPEERLLQFIELLTAEGGLIDAVKDDEGQMLIFRRSCPFINVIDEKQSVCWIDQELLRAVVGRPVRRVKCRHDGAPCCQFEVC